MSKIFLLSTILINASALSFGQALTITWTGGGGTNLWSNAANWDLFRVPTSGDVVGIPAGATVVFSTGVTTIQNLLDHGTLQVTGGTLHATSSSAISGEMYITGGTFRSGGDLTINDSLAHTGGQLICAGNLINNGGFQSNSVNGVSFQGTSNQLISGAGTTTYFNRIVIQNGGAANSNNVEITANNFTVPAGFLILTIGIFKISGNFNLVNPVFTVLSPVINAGAGIWLNNPNVQVTGQNGDVTLNGSLRITAGTFNVGTTEQSLIWGNNSMVTIEAGILNIAGKFAPSVSTSTNSIAFNMSGGTLNVAMGSAVIPNTSPTLASFDIPSTGAASSFTMSGGTIIIQKPAAVIDYRMAATNTISGGLVQFGNSMTTGSPAFNAGTPSDAINYFPSLTVNSTGTPTVTLHAVTTNIKGAVLVGSGTVLNAQGTTVAISNN